MTIYSSIEAKHKEEASSLRRKFAEASIWQRQGSMPGDESLRFCSLLRDGNLVGLLAHDVDHDRKSRKDRQATQNSASNGCLVIGQRSEKAASSCKCDTLLGPLLDLVQWWGSPLTRGRTCGEVVIFSPPLAVCIRRT